MPIIIYLKKCFVLYNRQWNLRERKRKWEEYNSKKNNYRQNKKNTSNLTKSPTHLKSSLQGYILQTPEQLNKWIRQCVHKCNTTMPKSGPYRCFVLERLVKKALKSHSMSHTMAGVLNRHHAIVPNHDHTVLQNMYWKLIKYKSNKDYIRLNQTVKQLTKNSNLQGAAKILNIPYTALQWLMNIKNQSERNISEEDKLRVHQVYSSNCISLQLPFKKYAKYHYLRSTLAVAYHKYVLTQRESGDRVLSKMAVYWCLKGKFQTRRKIPFKDCQCHTCVNNSLLVDALIVAGVKSISCSNM